MISDCCDTCRGTEIVQVVAICIFARSACNSDPTNHLSTVEDGYTARERDQANFIEDAPQGWLMRVSASMTAVTSRRDAVVIAFRLLV